MIGGFGITDLSKKYSANLSPLNNFGRQQNSYSVENVQGYVLTVTFPSAINQNSCPEITSRKPPLNSTVHKAILLGLKVVESFYQFPL